MCANCELSYDKNKQVYNDRIGKIERKEMLMANTIFDTDFAPDNKIIVYRCGEQIYYGEVGGMTDVEKCDYEDYDFYLLDEAVEDGYKAVFIG